MSTDLKFQQGLPQLRLPTRIKPSADEIPTIQTPKSGSNSDSGDDECRTPTSPEHKIPAMLSCPPAPKKPRRTENHKRKICELQFFEIVGREEIDSFFRSFGFVDLNSGSVFVMKRRRWAS